MFTRIAEGLRALDGVVEVRGRGALIGVELDRSAGAVRDRLRAAGVLVGTSGHPKTLRLMPPLTVTDAEIDTFLARFREALA